MFCCLHILAFDGLCEFKTCNTKKLRNSDKNMEIDTAHTIVSWPNNTDNAMFQGVAIFVMFSSVFQKYTGIETIPWYPEIANYIHIVVVREREHKGHIYLPQHKTPIQCILSQETSTRRTTRLRWRLGPLEYIQRYFTGARRVWPLPQRHQSNPEE